MATPTRSTLLSIKQAVRSNQLRRFRRPNAIIQPKAAIAMSLFPCSSLGSRRCGTFVDRFAPSFLSIENTSQCNNQQQPTFKLFFWGCAAAITALSVAFTDGNRISTFCETVHSTTPKAESTTDHAAAADDDGPDPYDNLPEEDEETNCSMCQTFRKGPCRPQWRKLERCFKDHENEENGAVTHCMRYFSPHQQCLMQYSNLYQLISLEQKQELVRDTELSVTKDERRPWKPSVDWSMLVKFHTEEAHASTFRQTLPHLNPSKTPLWQRYPPDTEPVLLTVTSNLPKIHDQTGMILKVAYAVDQDGYVLGFSYNKQYGALMQQTTAATDSTEKNNKQPQAETTATSSTSANEYGVDDTNKNTEYPLEFYLLPGETKSVRICALYAENPALAPSSKEILDALLFTSPVYSLQDAARKKTSKKTAKKKDKIKG